MSPTGLRDKNGGPLWTAALVECGDVGGDLRDPVQGKVSIEVRVHLRAVKHGRKN